MVTFLCSLIALILGYIFYGRFVAKFFGVDASLATPAQRLNDSVDYQVLPAWKIFLIQLLNIAGLGPIFGVILGALYGPVAYLWIVFGCIFMGAVHDFFAGFASLRNDGMSLPELLGKYLGTTTRNVMVIFSVALLLVVGVVFTSGPAALLKVIASEIWELFGMSGPVFFIDSLEFWIALILLYYLLSTILPIGKFIGKVYPLFSIALLFMVFGVGCSVLFKGFSGALELPELTLDTLRNFHSNPEKNMIFPTLFIVISCGAISGFHGTQSPMMARCLGSEKLARPIFYGAMIAEGIIALVWATVAMTYFGGPEGLNAAMSSGKNPSVIVNMVCRDWLGLAGAILAILGVVACPITSGDTAFRSIRLAIADTFKISQSSLLNRLALAIPFFIVAYFACQYDFSVIWRYLGIGNQVIATVTLWAGVAYLISLNKPHWLMSLPATFLSAVCISYFLLASHAAGGLALKNVALGNTISVIISLIILGLFIRHAHKRKSV